jgi:hypothetical protein
LGALDHLRLRNHCSAKIGAAFACNLFLAWGGGGVMAADKQREYKRAWGRVSAVLEKPADDPIWRDDGFWATRWPKLVDNAAQATENLAPKPLDKPPPSL